MTSILRCLLHECSPRPFPTGFTNGQARLLFPSPRPRTAMIRNPVKFPRATEPPYGGVVKPRSSDLAPPLTPRRGFLSPPIVTRSPADDVPLPPQLEGELGLVHQWLVKIARRAHPGGDSRPQVDAVASRPGPSPAAGVHPPRSARPLRCRADRRWMAARAETRRLPDHRP